jgi:hypothetical protein
MDDDGGRSTPHVGAGKAESRGPSRPRGVLAPRRVNLTRFLLRSPINHLKLVCYICDLSSPDNMYAVHFKAR